MSKGRYKTLARNTVVFAIGSFGSKILSLLLNNLYTKHIEPSEFYTKNLLEMTALFLLPVFTFSLTEAIIRFGLDRQYDKKHIFTTCSFLTVGGLVLMALFVPLLRLVPYFSPLGGYIILLTVYVTTSALRSLCSQFVRARELVRLYSFDGIFTTLMLFVFSVVFISVLDMGVKGFMLSVILSDLCSAVFLFTFAGLKKYISVDSFDMTLGKSMLRFTLPLIPTIVMWTIVTFSDQIFIGSMQSDRAVLGKAAAGLYAAAAKIPNLISMLSAVFFQAWNMSAITEHDSPERSSFYENVYKFYEAVLFAGAAGLLLCVKPVSSVLINSSEFAEYGTVYIYTPLLVLAAVFNCMNEFLFGIYTASKHTKNAFYTTLVTCITNLVLNYFLIPVMGIQGAALATLMSYLLCYCIRMIDARYYVPFKVDFRRTIFNSLMLLTMCMIIVFKIRYCWVLEFVLFAAVAAVNAVSLLSKKRKS